MKKHVFIILLIALSITVNAQKENFAIKDIVILPKTTEISTENYELKKIETVYDLALNLSYLHHISYNIEGDYLTLPVVTINNKPVDEKTLKGIDITTMLDYQFKVGEETMALYGTRAQYGYLIIKQKSDVN